MQEGWLRPFPARVETTEAEYRKARVYVYEGKATVFVAARRDVVAVAEAEVVQIEANRDRTTTLYLPDGRTWTLSRDGGCACGSPLNTYNPLAAVR